MKPVRLSPEPQPPGQISIYACLLFNAMLFYPEDRLVKNSPMFLRVFKWMRSPTRTCYQRTHQIYGIDRKRSTA